VHHPNTIPQIHRLRFSLTIPFVSTINPFAARRKRRDAKFP
jgi:hypothetical protein